MIGWHLKTSILSVSHFLKGHSSCFSKILNPSPIIHAKQCCTRALVEITDKQIYSLLNKDPGETVQTKFSNMIFPYSPLCPHTQLSGYVLLSIQFTQGTVPCARKMHFDLLSVRLVRRADNSCVTCAAVAPLTRDARVQMLDSMGLIRHINWCLFHGQCLHWWRRVHKLTD